MKQIKLKPLMEFEFLMVMKSLPLILLNSIKNAMKLLLQSQTEAKLVLLDMT